MSLKSQLYDRLADSAVQSCLVISGAFHPAPSDNLAPFETLFLLSPQGPGFWEHMSDQPEYRDGQADPIDRWSRRVILELAIAFEGQAFFPFGGPPYHPFQTWALRSGRAWSSPVQLLVHEQAGLMISYRGAIAIKNRVALPDAGQSPCETCKDRPCLTACPVGALADSGYNLEECHQFLDSEDGNPCMALGCAVRRSCPLSEKFGRNPLQSAHHMKAFHP